MPALTDRFAGPPRTKLKSYIPGLYPDAKKVVHEICKMVNAKPEVINKAMNVLTNIGKLPVDVPADIHGPFLNNPI